MNTYIFIGGALLVLVVAVLVIRWAMGNDQFDEDIKYLVFDKDDKDKMDPKEFKKAMKVNKDQEEKRSKELGGK